MFFITFIIAFCNNGVSQTQWEWIAPNPPRLPHAYSTTVVGTKAYFWCEGNSVFSTSDTGRSFTVYPQYGPTNNTSNGFYPMQGIAFADSVTGYIVDIAHGEFRTTDGGWTWAQKGSPGSNTVLVAFGSSKIGWKLGWAGFYRTTDAGDKWTFIQTPLLGDWSNLDGNFSKICVLDANNIWVLRTNQLSSSNPGPVWRSTNSGISWTNFKVGLSSDSMNQIKYNDLVLRSSGYGCITGSIYTPTANYDSIRSVVLMTTNFGNTWARKEFMQEDYTDIISISDSVWVLLGNTRPHSYDPWGQSLMRRTTNAGYSWNYSPAFGSDTIQNQHFYKSAYISQTNSIIATTTFGTYKSSDEGKSFAKLSSQKDMLVNYITIDKSDSSRSNQVIVCPSYGLEYLISQDGGSTWKRKQLPGYLMSTMKDVRVTNKKIYQITYDYQYTFQLASSTDFGESWNSTSVPSYGALRGLAVTGKDTVVMQAFPNMVKSVNGGMTWSQAPMKASFWLNESQIFGGGKIIAVGGFYDSSVTKGFVYVSTNGGFNWRIQDFPAELNQIKMVSDLTGFATGNDAKLYRTTDGGKTWGVTTSGVNTVAFFDSQRGIASNLQITTDGGATWNTGKLPHPFIVGFTSMEFNNVGDLFVSANGNFFKYPNAISVFPAVSFPNQETFQAITLEQNNPNPFNPSTTITLTLPSTSLVQLKVYDILGREIIVLFDGILNSGKHSLIFDGTKLASGVYFYKLSAGNFSTIKKMLLTK